VAPGEGSGVRSKSALQGFHAAEHELSDGVAQQGGEGAYAPRLSGTIAPSKSSSTRLGTSEPRPGRLSQGNRAAHPPNDSGTW
jgi:hypothetical protein